MQNKDAMQDFVISLLKKQIPLAYTYHNYEHTLYVQRKVKELSEQEHLGAHDVWLLDTAALWHDTGYIHTYKGHEEESCRLVRQHLPGYGFSEDDINIICRIIMATRVPQNPGNHLEEIMADADLAYLGSSGVAKVADSLFREMQYIFPGLSKDEWDEKQVTFLEGHQYFTPFYRETRDPLKQVYLKELRTKL